MSNTPIANLLTLKIDLTTSGNILYTIQNIDEKEFIKKLDSWDPEYENTHVIASIIRQAKENLTRALEDIKVV